MKPTKETIEAIKRVKDKYKAKSDNPFLTRESELIIKAKITACGEILDELGYEEGFDISEFDEMIKTLPE